MQMGHVRDKLVFVKRAHIVVMGLAAFVGWVLACASPTQARVRISRRDLPCATDTGPGGTSLMDFVVYVGRDIAEVDDRERNHVVAASLSCDAITPNSTIVLYPSETMHAVVRIVGGTKIESAGKFNRVPGERCVIGDATSCLRATRVFDYVENETIELPIVLDRDCVGMVCPGQSTCDSGSCQPSDCKSRSDCLTRNNAANDAMSESDVGVIHDASPSDGKVEDDASTRGADFTCVNGNAVFTPEIVCLGRPVCYDPTSGSGACGAALNRCEAGSFRPCCSRSKVNDGGYDHQCCLAAGNLHPIEVGTAVAPGTCSAKTLCFPGADDCPKNLRCVTVGGSGWGACAP